VSIADQIAKEVPSPVGMGGISPCEASMSPFNPKQISIAFTGSGSEYFRIWIVNLLLMLVTLGLYFPWAKVRRLRYFYGNTFIDSQALGFHGQPRQMFKGFLLVVLGFVLYSVAGMFSPVAALLAFLLAALLWPALFNASMRFRMRNTSWRGLRFSFVGTVSKAYSAWLPVFLPSACFMVLATLVPDLQDTNPNRYASTPIQIALTVMGIFSLLFFPWVLFKLKAYQHRSYRYSGEASVFTVTVKDYFWVSVKGLGVLLLGFILLLLISFFVAFGLEGLRKDFPSLTKDTGALVVLFFLIFILGSFFFSLVKPYFSTRFQNLIWSHTSSQNIVFTSTLGLWPMIRLTLKNWFFMLLTLGLYWPFATIAMARLRLEAVKLQFIEDPSAWIAHAKTDPGTAVGEISGDFFDFDVGL
jgi:uncharacterized membrane protein YjgN (DUF898 family)